MDVTTETRLVFNLVITEDEAREVVQDPKPLIGALKHALVRSTVRDVARRNGNGRHPKGTATACSCGASFVKPGNLRKHQEKTGHGVGAAVPSAA